MSAFLELLEKKAKSIIKLNALAAVAPILVAGAGFYGYQHVMTAIHAQDDKQALVLIAMEKQALPGKLLKVVDEKLGLKVPVETKVDVCNTLLMMCAVKNIPVSVACGLIEVESNWNPMALSPCGAKGLTQVMPATAKPYLRLERKSDNSNELYNPVTSIIVGLSYLADVQSQYIELGVTEPNNFTYALHSFFWGNSGTMLLIGKKTDAKVSVPNLAYPNRVLTAAKEYRTMGLF